MTPGVSSYFQHTASQEEFYYPSKVITDLKISLDELKSKYSSKYARSSAMRMNEKGDIYIV